MERGAFMRGTEMRQRGGSMKRITALGLGVLLALGVELTVLLLGSIAVSAGVLRADTTMQTTVAACLIGCFTGACFVCGCWRDKCLIGGLLTGLLCFALILVVALIGAERFEFGGQGIIEFSGCLIGGGLAGVTKSRKKTKHRKKRQK